MTFSNDAWQHNLLRYQTILTLPFNQELQAGTLTADRFKQYMIQDAHYLEGFARALSLAASKGQRAEHIVQFAGAAQAAILVERALHQEYFAHFGVSADAFAASEPSPVCDHYVSYLLRVAALEPFEVVLAAVLPCFWIYREVGAHIHQHARTPNPFQAWIDTYAGAEFAQAVQQVIAVVDEVATQASTRTTAAMHQSFTRATQLEWMFWDCAYSQTTWPV
jgi:thiaminase (transcriptional activator TenA)